MSDPVVFSSTSPDFATQAALWMGQHVLATWAMGSALAMTIGIVLWVLARCVHVPHERSSLSDTALVATHVGMAAFLWLCAGWLLNTLAGQIAAGSGILAFDLALTDALRQSLSVQELRWFLLPTWLSDPAPVVILALVVTGWLLWRGHRLLAVGWAAAVIGNALLNRVLKGFFERARPLHEHGMLYETGYSFPSGHSSATLATYGMLAYLVVRLAPRPWHLPAVLGAAWLAWTVAASRVALQVHYASDVLVGMCNGAAWLGMCILSVELVRQRERQRQR